MCTLSQSKLPKYGAFGPCIARVMGYIYIMLYFFRTSRNSLHGDLIECDFCPLSFHTNCLQPPLTNKPLGMWMCPNHAEHAEVTKLPEMVRLLIRVHLRRKVGRRQTWDICSIFKCYLQKLALQTNCCCHFKRYICCCCHHTSANQKRCYIQ